MPRFPPLEACATPARVASSPPRAPARQGRRRTTLNTAPLVLKSTKGMLEMQRLQPEMRKLQQQHRGDRQKLNEEMMKLYQEHKVNPLASCLPLVLQMPGVHHHVPGAARL